jgi:hypothetical protein
LQGRRSFNTNANPRSERTWAVRLPMPWAAPVIKATGWVMDSSLAVFGKHQQNSHFCFCYTQTHMAKKLKPTSAQTAPLEVLDVLTASASKVTPIGISPVGKEVQLPFTQMDEYDYVHLIFIPKRPNIR